MTQENKVVKKDLKICCALALCLVVLAVLPLVWQGMFTDWRAGTAFVLAQFVLAAPLVYRARGILQRGMRSLFGGVPAMEGLVFAACAACILACIAAGFAAVHGKVNFSALPLAPLAVMLVTVLASEYFKQNCKLQTDDENSSGISADATAAFVLPCVFAAALAAALSWWFYGLGAAMAWVVLANVLLAGSAGIFMLAKVLPLYFAAENAANNGYAFCGTSSIKNCRHITMSVFDDSFVPLKGQEITDIITAAVSEAQLLALAAGVTAAASHPLQEVFKKPADGLLLPVCSGVVKMRGGITAQCSKRNIRMGTLAFVKSVADISPEYAKYEAQLQKQGKTVFYITSGRSLQGIIATAPQADPGIKPVLHKLQKRGVRTVMFSSSGKCAAEYIAAKAGFDKTVAELLPEHQKELAETFCRAGEFVAVVRHTGGNAAEAVLYSPAGTAAGRLSFIEGNLHNLPAAISLSAGLRKICRQNNRLALWFGSVWVIAASCGWQLLFKSALPGAVLALMLIISALAVWLNSRRLKK